MTIAEQIQSLSNTKTAISGAITSKGGVVSSTAFSSYASAILSIPTGSDTTYYKCTAVEGGVVVTGVGEEVLSGVYVLADLSATGTSRSWINTATGTGSIFYGDVAGVVGWFMGDASKLQVNYMYLCQNADNPWDGQWQNWEGGSIPPTVTSGAGEDGKWRGQKITIAASGVTSSSTITSSLSYTSTVPVVNGIYNDGVTKRIYEDTMQGSNILSGVSILGVEGTIPTVTQPIPSVVSGAQGTITASYTQTAGYTSEAEGRSTTVAASSLDSRLTSSNILSGVTVFGVSGLNTVVNVSGDSIGADSVLSGVVFHSANGSTGTGNIPTVVQVAPSITVGGSIVVSGAGTDACNGTYTLTSGTGSSRVWEKGEYKIYWDGEGKWLIEANEVGYYTAEDVTGESDPWDLTWNDSAGADPEPTLTEAKGVISASYTPVSGYTSDAVVKATAVSATSLEPNLLGSNILSGVTIFGVQGTATPTTETKGSIQIDITGTSSGGWYVDGSSTVVYSGGAVTDISVGEHLVELVPVSGYTTPPSKTMPVSAYRTSYATAEYTPIGAGKVYTGAPLWASMEYKSIADMTSEDVQNTSYGSSVELSEVSSGETALRKTYTVQPSDFVAVWLAVPPGYKAYKSEDGTESGKHVKFNEEDDMGTNGTSSVIVDSVQYSLYGEAFRLSQQGDFIVFVDKV